MRAGVSNRTGFKSVKNTFKIASHCPESNTSGSFINNSLKTAFKYFPKQPKVKNNRIQTAIGRIT